MCINGPLTIAILSVISFYLLYLSLQGLLNKNIRYLGVIVICVCTIQALYGIGQFAGIFHSHVNFKIVGSFDNPAGFAACLAAGFPFCSTILDKTKTWKVIGYLCLGIISVAIILSGSRAGIIAITLVSAVYITHKYRRFIQGKKIYIIVLFVLTATSLILLKQDSTIGRIAIWNNSIEMIKEKPTFGHGEDGFGANYMPYQANYFEANPNSDYARLADNISHPFNEYILLIIEYGIIGLFLLFGVFITVLFSEDKPIVPLMCLLSVAVFACFSYPLRYPFVLILVAYSLATISKYSGKSFSKMSKIVRILMIATISFVAIMLIKDISFEYKWNKTAKEMALVNSENALQNYQQLYGRWNGNPLFLYNYGAVLNQGEHFSASNVVMKRCTNYLNDYYVQMILGDNYLNMGDLDAAKYHYELSHSMIPNRFMPLYCLMELHLKAKNHEKALEIANTIITKEIKVSSHTIKKILHKAQMVIDEIKNE